MSRTLSPKELARAIDVSESSLKRWADSGAIQVTRTAGGHRRIPLNEAIRFVRESELKLVHPELLGLRDVARLPASVRAEDGHAGRMLQYLQDGDTSGVMGLVMWCYVQGESVAAICDGPIRASLTALGEAWKTQPDGIFLEHRATDICMQALEQLRALCDPRPGAKVVLGGAPNGDPYILPSMMAATALGMEGLRAVNLGPETPASTMIEASRHLDVALLWLSVTSDTPTRAGLQKYLEALTAAFPDDVRIVIGGRTSHKLRPLQSPRIQHGASMSELVAFARGRFDAA